MATLTDSKVAQYVRDAGGDDGEVVLLTAISWAESDHRTHKTSPNPAGGLNYGNFQIHAKSHGVSGATLTNPKTAAEVALGILRKNGPGPWEVVHPGTPRFPVFQKKLEELTRGAKSKTGKSAGPLDFLNIDEWLEGLDIPYVSDLLKLDPDKIIKDGAVKTLDQMFGVVSDIGGFISALDTLRKPETWLRVVEVSAGTILLLMGLTTLVFTPQEATRTYRKGRRRLQVVEGGRAARRAERSPAPTRRLETYKRMPAERLGQPKEAFIDIRPSD